MFTCSPQEQIIVEFIKMTPFKNVYMHLIINTVLLPEWSTTVFFCLVIVAHESLVCHEQVNCLLFRCLFQVPQNLCFSSIFCVFEPFPTMTDFEIHFFTPRTSEGLRFATITEDSNAPWCSRRKNHALRARAWKLLNRMKVCIFFLFCLNIIFFHLGLPLMHGFSFWSISEGLKYVW